MTMNRRRAVLSREAWSVGRRAVKRAACLVPRRFTACFESKMIIAKFRRDQPASLFEQRQGSASAEGCEVVPNSTIQLHRRDALFPSRSATDLLDSFRRKAGPTSGFPNRLLLSKVVSRLQITRILALPR